MSARDDVRTLRDFLSRQGSTEAAWKALDRIEEALPKPAYETGYYQLSVSGLYWYEGSTDVWYDVTQGYKTTTYPRTVNTGELVRLYRADEVSALA